MKMAGPLHPPCRRKKLRPLRPRLTARTALCSVPSSSPHAAGRAGAPVFLPEENEKTGRARSKREKEVTGDATGARLNERRSRNDFPRAIRLSGGLSFTEWTSFSFCCRTLVVAPELRLPAFEGLFLKQKKVYRRKNGRPSIFFNSQGAAAKREERPFVNHQNPRSNYAAGRRHAYPEEAPLARPPSHVPPQGRSFFFSFGPCTARFLFFFWKKKRKWGVQ